MPRPARPKQTSTARIGDPRLSNFAPSVAPATAPRWRDDPRLWAAGIVLFICVAFAPLFTSDFTNIDDPATIAHNPKLNPPTLASLLEFWDPRKPQLDLYIPVTYTVWSALALLAWLPTPDAAGIQLNPWMFHGANVALHALSALVVFQILRLLVRPVPIAAAGALLFALHPVQVEPVGWASGTKDVLCGLFSLVALWGYLRYARPAMPGPSDDQGSDLSGTSLPSTPGRPGPGSVRPINETPATYWSLWYCLATAALILAMLSKPTAIITPLIAATLDLLVLRRSVKRIARAILPWMLLTIPILIEGRLAQPAAADYAVPLHLRPLIATDALAFYLYKLAWPANLAFIYDRSPQAVIAHGWLWWTWLVPLAVALAVIAPLWTRTRIALPSRLRFRNPPRGSTESRSRKRRSSGPRHKTSNDSR